MRWRRSAASTSRGRMFLKSPRSPTDGETQPKRRPADLVPSPHPTGGNLFPVGCCPHRCAKMTSCRCNFCHPEEGAVHLGGFATRCASSGLGRIRML